MNLRKYFLAGFPAGLLLFIACLWLTLDEKPEPPETFVEKTSNPSRGDFSQWLDNFESSSKPSEIFLQEGTKLAKRRMSHMRRLIMEDPASALESAVTRAEWESLPDEIKPYVEKRIKTIADVYVSIVCMENSSRIETFTKLRDGTGFMTYTAPGNRYNRTRTDVEIEGVRLGDIGALANFLETKESVSLRNIEEAPTSSWNMYVILIDFSDRDAWFIDNAVVDNDINTIVSQQVAEMSFNQLSVNCTVHPGVFRMPQTIDYYDQQYSELTPMMDAIHADVTDPQNGIGVDVSSYDTVCVISKSYPPFTFGGYANISGPKMWIQVYNPGFTPSRTITHELGHNLGSYHASSWDVTSSDPVDPAGTSVEYGDPFDIMGTGQIPKGHFHIQNKHRVGWVQDSNYTDVTSSGTYRVYRTDHPMTDPAVGEIRGLRIDKGTNEYYWVGYRQLFTEHENAGRGVHVLWQQDDPYGYIKSHLLDMTPGSTGGKWDGGLAMGRTYSDPTAGVHITPVDRGGYLPNEYMDVMVNLGNATGNRAPTATISGPATGFVLDSLEFTVTANDLDGDDLAYAWDFGDGIVKENSSSTKHAFTSVGSTTVRCTVTDMKGGEVTVELTITLSHPLENWTNVGPIAETNYHLNDITSGNGKLVTVGNGGFVAISTDGENWTTGYVGGLIYWQGVVFDGIQFVAVGNKAIFNQQLQTYEWFGTIFSSVDGVSWTQRYLSTTPSTVPLLKDIAYGDGTYIAIGIDASVVRASSLSSWTASTVVDPNTSTEYGDFSSISFVEGAFCVVGYKNGGGPLVLITFSGFSWPDKSTGANTGSWAFASIENCNGSLLAGGSWIGLSRSTNRGYNFTTVSGGNYNLTGFAYGNGVYFGTGNFNPAGAADINVVSPDGVNWIELTTIAQEDRLATAFFNNSFVTVGKNGAVWKSDPVGDPQAGWATWQIHYNDVLGINRDSSDDADGDGAENVLEYGLGTDPGDPSSVPAIHAIKDEANYLYITIPRAFRAHDIEYVVEQTNDLNNPASWSGVNTVEETDTDTELTVRTVSPLSTNSPQFLRLRVR